MKGTQGFYVRKIPSLRSAPLAAIILFTDKSRNETKWNDGETGKTLLSESPAAGFVAVGGENPIFSKNPKNIAKFRQEGFR